MWQKLRNSSRRVGDIRRANSFVRLLGAFAGCVAIGILRQVRLAITGSNMVATRLERILADPRAVGAHVSNETDRTLAAQFNAFIKPLGQHHGFLGRGMQPIAGLLLEGARRERRRRLLLAFLLLDLGDGVGGAIQGPDDLVRLFLIRGFELLARPLG